MTSSNGNRRPLQIVVENGEPSAVIIDIQDYRELLERLEDAHDLRQLDEMRKRALEFKSLDEFIAEYSPDV